MKPNIKGIGDYFPYIFILLIFLIMKNTQRVNIRLKRIFKGPNYTIGKLYVDGKYYCDTLEDTDRGLKSTMSEAEIKQIKVYAKTAIPTGTYDVIVNVSPKFQRNLPRLMNVPGYTGILIHRGNTPQNTAGCILVGENTAVGKVLNSTKYELALTELIRSRGGATITIE